MTAGLAAEAGQPICVSVLLKERLGLDGAHQQPRRISDSPNRGLVLISSFIALRRAFFFLAGDVTIRGSLGAALEI